MSQPILIEISPKIPESLARLPELASNLYFGWHRPTRALFEDLAPDLWRQTGGNPKLLLRCVGQVALDRASADPTYLQRYRDAIAAFDTYLASSRTREGDPLVAYFCAEYGFHESFPIYSGGLGVLAGDHCKAASDERLNFVAVGLLYGQGYFTQNVDSDGVQHAMYADHDPRDLPVEPVRRDDGEWITVSVRMAARDVCARVWRARVGRVHVYLLDTNCPGNSPADRLITHRLYGGDESTRIRQEMILGIGGVRALRALGLAPEVWHINEGHAAFLILEQLREHRQRGVDFDAALEAVAARCAFTTHTPVAAGHDKFGHDLFVQHFADFIRELGVPLDRVLDLGRSPEANGAFNMTRLALSGARHVNGVSRIHGRVSRRLCQDQWREVPPDDNVVGYVTNGVHVPTYLHQSWAEFFDHALAADWRERLSDEALWRGLEHVRDEAFWRTRQNVKSRMLSGVRERLRREFDAKGMSPAQWRHATRYLDPERPEVLTIGFARRFATYKRAALILRDRARLARLVNDPERPLLLLFAGKAHPADEPGKAVLREIKQLMLTPQFAGRVLFLDDYDIRLARWLVSGCDVWLNNPITPLEASGTSGIKAAVNGSLNLSVLDGWWAESWDGENGWGISPVAVQDPERRDALEAGSILDALEEEVLPLYYTRTPAGIPAGWVARSKHAMATVIPRFSMRRVIADYAEGIYYPAARHGTRLDADDGAAARGLAAFRQRVRHAWPRVTLQRAAPLPAEVAHGDRLEVRVAVQLAGLDPHEVAVELLARRVLPDRPREFPPLTSYRAPLHDGLWRELLAPTGETTADGAAIYVLAAPSRECGQYEVEVRAFPTHDCLAHPYELGLMKRLEGA
jgi:starch phosphorylase